MDISGKKILVTGAAGFIGSHLIESLIRKKCLVRAFAHYNSFNRWGWIEYLDDDVRRKLDVFAGDVRDPHGVKTAMEGVDIVFHLAALIGIPFSYHSPDSYVETNIRGTLNVLQSARHLGLEKILVTSTSEVYGSARYVPIDENHPRQGQSPYSATKIGADAIAESFYRSFDLPLVIVRPFNTYGPRQSARAIIPAVIVQLLCGNGKIRLGDLSPTRDMVYVKDTVAGFIAIAQSDKTIGEEINIATRTEISIGDLVRKIIDMLGGKAETVTVPERERPENSEVRRLLGDYQKIVELTGWKPEYSLDKGLEETIEWFRQDIHLNLYKPDIYNI